MKRLHNLDKTLAASPKNRPNDKDKWRVLIAMSMAVAIISIDMTAVSVALPDMARQLHLSQKDYQLVVTLYVLSMACLAAVSGRVNDIVGRRRGFIWGVVVFSCASAAVGGAWNTWSLLLSRTLQGCAAAFMLTSSAALAMNAFPFSERGKASGIYSLTGTVFLAVGPLIGGLLTEYASWRYVFFMNVPIGVTAIVLTVRCDITDLVADNKYVDWTGLILLVGGTGALVLALTHGGQWGWDSVPALVLVVAGVTLLTLFYALEARVRHPLVDFRLYRDRSIRTDIFVLFCARFCILPITVFFVFYLQHILILSPFASGLSLLPIILLFAVTAIFAGYMFDRVGVRPLSISGTAVAALGLVWLGVFLGHRDYVILIPGMVLFGFGAGASLVPSYTDVMNRFQEKNRGQAAGVLQTVNQLGGTIGMAVSGAIVTTTEHGIIKGIIEPLGVGGSNSLKLNELQGTKTGLLNLLSQTDTVSPATETMLKETITNAIAYGCFFGAAVIACAFITSLLFLRSSGDCGAYGNR
ncbi:MAG: MFS transporter [Desulfobacteraceae bacterium]|nr:MFS transporter [Desulfobacteraceae bacterium]